MLDPSATAPAPPRPIQARALRTRAALVAAAERIAGAEGADSVTTTRVANEAGVSVGAVYRYFPDREALLLAAYDASVDGIIAECRRALAALSTDMQRSDAARHILTRYLEAAAGRTGHRELLRAMRSIRPIEADHGAGSDRVVAGLLAPFLSRFGPAPDHASERLHFLNVLMSTLVDLYLMTDDAAARSRLLAEIEAHMLLALERLSAA